MITLVIPVSTADMHLAILLAKQLRWLGGLKGRRILVTSSRAAAWDINLIMQELPQAELYVLPTEDESGWPSSANHMFYSVVEYLETTGNDRPWYFLEADNMPLVPGWLAAFDAEYELAGKPYMGAINVTRYMNLKTGETFERGEHMVGTGIYPADFARRCKSVHYFNSMPFDVCIEKEVVPQCHHTSLIAHRWGTVNYRLEGGRLMMDDKDPKFKYAAPIPPEAVIIHGCKDDSLYKLLDPGVNPT